MSARYWVEFWLNNGAAWFLTYLLYSTLILGGSALAVRLFRLSAGTENMLWRVASGVVPFLAALRIAVEHVDGTPVVAGPEITTVSGTLGWTMIWSSAAVLAAALWLTGRFGRVAWAERDRLATRTPVNDVELVEQLSALARAAGRTTPRFTQSPCLRAPVAIGSREICIPSDVFATLSPEGSRAVLAHELAHLVRRDSLWMTWVQVLERVFFVQPLQRWAGRRMRETAEFAADDFAVRHGPGPDHLVDALATFARASGGGVAVSGFAPGSLLVRRVERVLSGAARPEQVRAGVVVAFVAALAALAWFSPAVVPACDCRIRAGLAALGALLGTG